MEPETRLSAPAQEVKELRSTQQYYISLPRSRCVSHLLQLLRWALRPMSSFLALSMVKFLGQWRVRFRGTFGLSHVETPQDLNKQLFPVYPNKTKAHRWCDSDAGGSGKNRPAGFCLQSSEPPAVMLPLETSTSDHVKCLTIKQQPSTVHLLTFRLISQSFFSLTPQVSPVYCSYHNTFKAAFV